MHHRHTQESLSYPSFIILASLLEEPKTVTALRQAVAQATEQVIEPAAFSRVVARLERRGWIASEDGAERVRLYHLTAQVCLLYSRQKSHTGEIRKSRNGMDGVLT
jgi:DNA-binding MarR family transcriptional regulator